MDLSFLNPLFKLVPAIRKPSAPLSFREKLKWSVVIMVIYYLMFSTPAFGVNTHGSNQAILQLISVIFASKIGSLITVGIGPIVLASIVLQLLTGTGLINIDLNDQEQKGRFQSLQKLAAIVIAVVESYIFVATGYVPLFSQSYAPIVVFQLALCAIFIIFLDESMTKWGITSGINLFIAGGVAYSLIAGTSTILVKEAADAIQNGGATAIPNAILAFGPLFFAIVVFLVSIYIYEVKVEIPIVFSQLRGVGGRLPIPFLYVSVIPIVLATSFELSLTVWFRFFVGLYSGAFGNIAKFLALYQAVPTATGTQQTLIGGLVYLISPNFPLPYSTTYGGIGGYGAYFSYLATGTSQLYLPWGGVVAVPEFMHIIIYTLVLCVLAVIFGKFWVEMTGQSPKNVAEQLQDVGWQVPGFRRDPRIIESILNKYIPTITVLGSIFVALLASLATLTGAVGTGMGILLTVGIMYMVYQQLEQGHELEQYPALNKLLS